MGELLDAVQCQLDKCGGTIPLKDGDCCSGFNDKGECVKGKYNEKSGNCVIYGMSTRKKVLFWTGIVFFVLLLLGIVFRKSIPDYGKYILTGLVCFWIGMFSGTKL